MLSTLNFQLSTEFSRFNSPSPKVWMDAYLAAFAITGPHCFVTTDKDFEPFVKHGLQLELITL